MVLPTQRPVRHALILVAATILVACGGEEPPRIEQVPAAAAGFDLPADGEPPGWSRVTEPEHYAVDNLWEYINGQADFFIDYGFERVDTAEYRNQQESISVVLEVYRMGRPQEAFAIFAAERTPDDRPLELGAAAYLGANVLGFWQAEFYVKLTTFGEGPAVEALLIDLAKEVSSRVSGQAGELEAFLLFPEEGRVEASERLIPKNFLGQPYLTDAFRVDYILDGERVQLFVIETGSDEEARSSLQRLEDFYRQRDQAQVTLDTTVEPPTLIVDGPSRMIVFQLDHRLGGAIGMQSLEAGQTAAAALVEKIRR